MQENRLLGSLSHFSILFAPFIFPLVVWLFTEKGTFSHNEAKLAFKIHILPVLLTIITLFVIGGIGYFTNDTTVTSAAAIPLLVITIIVDISAGIYSLYRGIRILMA